MLPVDGTTTLGLITSKWHLLFAWLITYDAPLWLKNTVFMLYGESSVIVKKTMYPIQHLLSFSHYQISLSNNISSTPECSYYVHCKNVSSLPLQKTLNAFICRSNSQIYQLMSHLGGFHIVFIQMFSKMQHHAYGLMLHSASSNLGMIIFLNNLFCLSNHLFTKKYIIHNNFVSF